MRKHLAAGNSRVAVAYLRASKDEQRLSPEAQRASIEGWASREGVSVVSWHIDQGVCSVTAIDERPALLTALAALRDNGAGILVVAKRDRIARDVVLTAGVEREAARMGAQVVSAAGEGNGSTPADGFMRTVIDGAAQYERALIRARTKAALGALRARGQRFGQVPYGYVLAEDGKRLVSVSAELETVRRARELAATGMSQRAVAAALANEGRVSRSSKPFAPAQIARMLASIEVPVAA